MAARRREGAPPRSRWRPRRAARRREGGGASSYGPPPVVGEPLDAEDEERHGDEVDPDALADPHASVGGRLEGAIADPRLDARSDGRLGVRPEVRGEGVLAGRGAKGVEARFAAAEDRPTLGDRDRTL